MKSIKFLTILSFLFAVVVFQFCEKEVDPCEAIVCLNGGTCDDGTCTGCDVGYEGDLCTTLSRTKLLGTYTGAVTTCISITYPNTTITADASDNLKSLITLSGSGSNILNFEIIMTGSTTFDVPTQLPCPSCVNQSGSGSIDETTGIVTFSTTENGAGGTPCEFTITPQ